MNHPKDSLWQTPVDERDFKLGAIVGTAPLSELPGDFEVAAPLVIKDQGYGTDMCTAYALTSVSEDEEGVALDPFYSFGAIKAITGNKEEWGADLRSAAKSAVLREGPYGFLAAKDISKLENPATQEDRELAADYDRISKIDMEDAIKHAKRSYFSVDGPYDFFDNVRSAMWQARAEKRSVLTGCNWRSVWVYAPGGFIDKAEQGKTFGHAVKVFGWTMHEGSELVMKLQLSNGKGIGNNGVFYITREAFNQAFQYGGFTFLDLPREDAEKATKKAESVSTFFTCIRSPFTKLFNILHL